ncbi:MAG: hypothetical protein HY901_11395 [Deltaproteobacteria bacterium]|nr:hypothetical protein [Deltaproteobacteria bacterium]
MDLADLVPIYVPSLLEILAAAEKKKGAPLTEAEVLNVRDTATVVMLSRERADQMRRGRGRPDVDPERCWEQWQELRTKIR